MEKNINIKQNTFITFILNYSSVLIPGAIIYLFLYKFIKMSTVMGILFFFVLFIGAIVKAILVLKNNNRNLIISESGIQTAIGKNKKLKVLQYIRQEDVIEVSELADGIFSFKLKDGKEELLTLSYYLKPTNKLILEVKNQLVSAFKEKAESLKNDDLNEYLSTYKIPQKLLKSDNAERLNQVALTTIDIILVGIPTILGCLGVIYFILQGMILVLTLLMKILSNFT